MSRDECDGFEFADLLGGSCAAGSVMQDFGREFVHKGGEYLFEFESAPARVRSLYFSPEFPVALPESPIEVLPLLRELIVAACARGPLLAFRPDHVALAELLRYELGMALTHPVGLPWPQSEWLQRFATSAADTPADADRLIAETGYSRRTVERAMVAQTRLSLGRWLRQARMLRALAILSGGGSVGEAALGAGYSEPSAFIHAFRHAYGVTPGRLRG